MLLYVLQVFSFNIYIYCVVLKRLATPSDFQIPLPSVVHSPTRRSLSFMAGYIPSFQVLRGRLCFFLPSGIQLIIIFSSHVGSILSI